MIAQGLTAITYASEYQIISLSIPVEYIVNLLLLIFTTLDAYMWFEYLMLTEKNTEKYVLRSQKKILLIPVFIVSVLGIPSQWTHWIFFIDSDGIYRPGSLYYLQFIGILYYFAAMIFAGLQSNSKKDKLKILRRFMVYLVPTLIGAFINLKVLRGGYTQIGCSYALLLVYLEQYISESNMNRRLQAVENINKKFSNMEDDFIDQMNIVSGLSNAFFSAYSVDLKNGRCNAIKVIDYFRNVVKNCHTASIVTNAFIVTCVSQEDRKKMREFTDWHSLIERLSRTDLIVQEFHGTVSPWEWCRASWIAASRDENGNARNALFTVEDITESVRKRMQYEQERERIQKELEKSQAVAEAANKAKTEFLFHMSHDIRTPMNAIIGYADLMEKHFDEKERCEDYLLKIKKSGKFLLSLVNNVLEMARIESGKIVLNEVVCTASDFLDQIDSVYSELMRQKKIAFTTNVDVKTLYYYGDKVKLSEIFLNLVSNAYKYTNEGGKISLSVQELPCKKEDNIILKTVITDTGIGMSEEFLPEIFEEFSREHTTTENKIEGTGLGMPIVKRLVDFMDGTITVKSELNKGSTFTVILPHKIAEEKMIKKETDINGDPDQFIGKRLLLVEDNDLNTEIATEILKEFGFIVEHAEDGLVCLDMLSHAEDGYYKLILMDIQMPNLDGYETTKRIRRMTDRKKAAIPIIAMTANAFEEDRQNALLAGMNGHLAKPIDIKELIRILKEIFVKQVSEEKEYE